MVDQVVPTRLAERIATLDVLRGIAICGILLMNIPEMGMVGQLGMPALPAALNRDWLAFGVQHVLFDGTMRGLFTMLFGAGMLLMLRRADGPEPVVAPIDVWTRRCLGLMALGVVQWLVLLWPGEILWQYGVCGLFLLPFRLSRPRTLLIAASILFCGFVALDVSDVVQVVRQEQTSVQAAAVKAAGKPLSAVQTRALEAIEKRQAQLHPTAQSVERARRQRTHWPRAIDWSWGRWSWNLSSTGMLYAGESLCFMLIGMALFRLGILTGEAPTATYLRLMAIGFGGGLAMRVAATAVMARQGFDIHVGQESPVFHVLRWCSYEPSRLLMTLGYLGLIVLVFRAGWLGRAAPLRALGRMALTTYTLQSAITAMLFEGFGLLGRIGFAGLMAMCVLIWVATGLFCVVWLRFHAMGPVEWLLRRVAYGTARSAAVRREGEAASAAIPAI